MAEEGSIPVQPQERLTSLDVFRGLTMIFLISHAFGLHHLQDVPYFGAVATQFTHHKWHGLRLWDLIQPAFMFIVGVAMPFSLRKRERLGQSRGQMMWHVVKRCLILAFLGVVVLRPEPLMRGEPSLTNVLAQIAVTYFITYLFIRRSIWTQLAITAIILIGYDLAYRFIPLPYEEGPWVIHKNLGAYVDHLLGCRKSSGGWVSINAFSTAAHTMWGAVAGWVLMSDRTKWEKMRFLGIAAIVTLSAGFALDPVTPIIKRIATSTFVLASGGCCFLGLLFFYWLVDVKGYKRWGKFATIVGMNCVFIYVFTNLLGGWLHGYVGTFVKPFLGSYEVASALVITNVALLVKWYLCYWLYKHRIFIRA